jgi:hypothetical protein
LVLRAVISFRAAARRLFAWFDRPAKTLALT